MKDTIEVKEKKDRDAFFNWADPFLISDQLSEEERMISETAASFANKELSVRVEKAYNEEIIDEGIFKLMGDTGLLGCTIPEEFGGLGANYVSYGLITREIEKVDSGYRSMMSVQSSLVMYPISNLDPNHKRKIPTKLASGESVGCFGLTEANSGSDPASMTTKAKKVAGGFELNGSKMWISNAPIADVFVIWAKSEFHENKIKGFILEKNFVGLETKKYLGN